MKPITKVMIFVTLIVSAILFTGCGNDQQPTLTQQQLDAISQTKTDFIKLEERVKMLENQVKALNDEIYQGNKRVEALEEVYDYVAQDNNVPDTEESLSD